MGKIRVLELRIHGIANSPPEEQLCAKGETIERVAGDALGSFWRIKAGSGTADRSAENYAPAPPEVVTEAYSWGNQARSGATALAFVKRSIVHLCWLFVLPFGLCNLAYWARRRIGGDREELGKRWHGGDGADWVRVFALLQTLFYTVGFVTVFVHLIGMGCFPPVTDGGNETQRVCAALPAWVDVLADWKPTGRAAILGIAPVAILCLMYVVAVRARSRFHPDVFPFDEGIPRTQRKKDKASHAPYPPLLGSQGFWVRTRIAQTSERTHLAASLALVLTILAFDAVLDTTDLRLADVVSHLPDIAAKAPIPLLGVILGATLLAATFVMTWLGGVIGDAYGQRIQRGIASLTLLLTAGLYVAWTVWAIIYDPGDLAASALSGMILVPTTIAALGALIAVASMSWGYPWRYQVAPTVLIILALISILSAETVLRDWQLPILNRAFLSFAAAGMVLLAILSSYAPLVIGRHRDSYRSDAKVWAWHGNGAAVSLLVAWFSSLVITSLLVLGMRAFLRVDADPTQTADYLRVRGAVGEDVIPAVRFYEHFAGILVVILLFLVVAAIAAAVAALRRFPAFSLPGLRYPRGLRGPALDARSHHDRYLGGASALVDGGAGALGLGTVGARKPESRPRPVPRNKYPISEWKPTGRLRAVAGARRYASLLHRGEPMLRWLAISAASALLLLGIPFLIEYLDGTRARSMRAEGSDDPALNILDAVAGITAAISDFSGWALGILGLAAVAWVIANAAKSGERPLALVWDIIGFFPRAGHPFSPPCYAERAVPEVRKRVKEFIREEKAVGNEPYVILSSHSMGATIAVAVIFSLNAEKNSRGGEHQKPIDAVDRIGLLTHGVQLRAYFSRFFPQVFGPNVLGVRGTTGPALLRSDPWVSQVKKEHDDPRPSLGAVDGPPTIVSILGGDFTDPQNWRAPRWRNLWRRTDMLGFPVLGYWSPARDHTNENPIDRGATERSPRSYLWDIARHTDYLSTAQYIEAREELLVGFLARHHHSSWCREAVNRLRRTSVISHGDQRRLRDG